VRSVICAAPLPVRVNIRHAFVTAAT